MRSPALVTDQAGFTGAEKALMICFALSIVAVTGGLVTRGSDKAATDAQHTLMQGAAGSEKLGAVPATGTIATAGTIAQVKDSALAGFSADYRGAAGPAPAAAPAGPVPRPAPAPQKPITLVPDYQPIVDDIPPKKVSIMRIGLLPKSDPLLAALRDELKNPDIDPAAPNGIITVWRADQGGSAAFDKKDGNVSISKDGVRVFIFKDGAMLIANDNNNTSQERDRIGRLRSYSFLTRTPKQISLSAGYRFAYDKDGKLTNIEVIGGPQAGKWEQKDGVWRNTSTGKPWSGPNGPETWPGILGGRARLNGIVDAANTALDTEWKRLQKMWSEALPEGKGGWSEVTSTLDSLRTVVGMGFSGEGGNVVKMSEQIKGLSAEMQALKKLQGQIEGSQDPSEIKKLSDDYVARATALRDKLDKFRTDSDRILKKADKYGRAWELGKDIYGLGTAGGSKGALWNLSQAVKHSIDWLDK